MRDEQTLSSPRERLHPRAARIKLAATEDYLAHLEFARRARSRMGEGADFLDTEINAARNEVAVLAEWADARIEPRKRTPAKVFSELNPRPEYWVFLDECGHHHLRVKVDPFSVFCLCAVIIAERDLAAFDALWKGWKTRWLGNPLVKVHEPEVRHRSYHFYRPDPNDQAELLRALDEQLEELPFTCIAAVIDKQRFERLYPTGTVDDFLPTSCYLICVDFVMERLVHFLSHFAGDARGNVVSESRGEREDAEVHLEFLRLHLQGTQWQSEQQFRHQLRPYIEFHRKDGTISGLEIADLVARPIADKVLRPASSPPRWDVVSGKIYDGGKGRKSSYGLKIFPTPEEEVIFNEVKTGGDAEAPPSADQQTC